MRYPGFDDYMKAVQRPDAFTTDELRGLDLVVHPVFQIPSPASGASAVVFKAMAGDEARALRFFTRADASNSRRYDALRGHFTSRNLTDAVALPRWIDDGIRVGDRTWPVVEMPWVEGHTLNRHVDGLVEHQDTGALGELARSWRGLVHRLQQADFAHGDLQHGNVLVDARGTLRLVDFDCAWIEDFAGGTPPAETGHHNYQPPGRPWGRWMDTFPGLVIYLSLSALALRPTWSTLNTDDNLLFTQQDFQSFDTPAWRHLASLGDPRIDQLAARLRECCSPGWTAGGALDDLLTPAAVPWWQRTPTVVAGSAGHEVPPPKPEIPPQPAPAPPPPPRKPVANWWEATTPAPAAPVRKKKPAVWLIAIAAVVAWFLTGVTSAALLAAADADEDLATVFATIAFAVVLTGGLLGRRRQG